MNKKKSANCILSQGLKLQKEFKKRRIAQYELNMHYYFV